MSANFPSVCCYTCGKAGKWTRTTEARWGNSSNKQFKREKDSCSEKCWLLSWMRCDTAICLSRHSLNGNSWGVPQCSTGRTRRAGGVLSPDWPARCRGVQHQPTLQIQTLQLLVRDYKHRNGLIITNQVYFINRKITSAGIEIESNNHAVSNNLYYKLVLIAL